MSQIKLLRRSRTNRVFAGVCGGLGEYFTLDPVFVRVLWIIISLVSGGFPGLIAYLLVMLVMPETPPHDSRH